MKLLRVLGLSTLLALGGLGGCANLSLPTSPAPVSSAGTSAIGAAISGPRPAPAAAPSTAPAATSAAPAGVAAPAAVAAPVDAPRPPPADGLVPITPAELGSSSVAGLETPADLWDRIRRGFAMPNLDSPLVRQQEQWYASRPDYIQRMTERSRKYLFHIVEELERRNMPTELALLPFIESAFNPQAVSSARAAGMWQFMPATGRFFELKQNLFRDDRRDVLASTRAALDYLQKLYGMFGDWHLALAAYNWGEGSVGRAIARNQKAGLATGYTDLNMPGETRNYVPKLQAVKNIVASPPKYATELPLIENHPYFQEVEINRDIDVALAAQLAEVQVGDFKALNPHLNRPIILAAGTPQILLPWDSANVFKRNYESYKAGQLASWTAWRVPSTMTVAEAARRVSMSEGELRSVNSIPPRMLVKGGSVLVVARSGRTNANVDSRIADNGQLNLAPEVQLRKRTVKAVKGDSVATVARRFGVKAADVAQWNHVGAEASFKAGQQVVVYTPAQAKAKGKGGTKVAKAGHSGGKGKGKKRG